MLRRCHLFNLSLYIDAFEGSYQALKERVNSYADKFIKPVRSVLSVLGSFMNTIVFREKYGGYTQCKYF